MTFDDSSRTFTIESSYGSDAGTHTITITGTIYNTVSSNSNPFATTNIVLTVTDPSTDEIALLTSGLSVSEFYYTYTDIAGYLIIDQFTENSSVYTQSDI